MSITKTIGGDRLGAGKKMQAHLHNYFRSTHNLSEKFASSMGPGMLIPCLVKPAMRGDTFEINLNADVRTIPTKGPLFGSYKLQIDIFQCPVRLYQALLHNNPQAIGLNMQQIRFPLLRIKGADGDTNTDHYKFSNSSLLKYLGISGLGTPYQELELDQYASRDFNAIPALAYYDIYKNYYANKQEEKGIIIKPVNNSRNILTKVEVINNGNTIEFLKDEESDTVNIAPELSNGAIVKFYFNNEYQRDASVTYAVELGENTYLGSGDEVALTTLDSTETFKWLGITKKDNFIITSYSVNDWEELQGQIDYTQTTGLYITSNVKSKYPETVLQLEQFDLKNIDDMRYNLLSHHQLGEAYILSENMLSEPLNEPYKTLVTNVNGLIPNTLALNGIAIKTYQNDIYNNWLNSEWIEGENSIGELSKVEVVDGAFSMDALNFAEKLYNMLNRVVISGNTFEDWQDVVYEQVKRKQIESPIYCGGLSQEVRFDEIVQSAPADGDPLGTLGGRGRLDDQKRKGGHLYIKCDEACFIIGIVSLTPRIFYTQSNEFYMTDLLSMDDFHKPAMDGIGFQDLIGERLAWFDTQLRVDGGIAHRSKIGKIPAWLEYMTSVDKAYGDFADTEGLGYMILNRNYEQDAETKLIKDATTYIDPEKYNYAFAYDAIDAQNFWLMIAFDIKARRLMSARIIPNV